MCPRDERLAVGRGARGQWARSVQDRPEYAASARGGVEYDEHGRGQVRREPSDHGPEALDTAGGRADDDERSA